MSSCFFDIIARINSDYYEPGEPRVLPPQPLGNPTPAAILAYAQKHALRDTATVAEIEARLRAEMEASFACASENYRRYSVSVAEAEARWNSDLQEYLASLGFGESCPLTPVLLILAYDSGHSGGRSDILSCLAQYAEAFLPVINSYRFEPIVPTAR